MNIVMKDRTGASGAQRAIARLLLAVFGVAALAGMLIPLGAGLASADVASEKVKVQPGYQELVDEQKEALCIGNEPRGDDKDSEDGESPSASPSASPSPSAEPSASPEASAGGDENICGDKTEDLWKAAAQCSEGKTAASKSDVDSEAKSDFMDCMAKEGFGEKDEEKKEDPETAEQMAKLTLGRVSASLTAFYVNELSPAAAEDEEESEPEEGEEKPAEAGAEAKPQAGLAAWGSILSAPSMAGGFVGSLDRSKGESNEWLFGPGNSANTAEVKYSAFDRNVDPGGYLGSGRGASVGMASNTTDGTKTTLIDPGTQGYLTYGAMLGGLGLDTAVNKDDGLSGLLNAPGPRGYVLLLAYLGTGFLDTVFDSVLEALQYLNPFRFMIEAITGNYGDGAAGSIDDPVEGEQAGAFDGVRDAFGQIYDVLLNIGWLLVVPILLISLAVGAVFLKQAGTGGKVKKILIVVVFMAAGLPVFGGLYTAALNSMATSNVGSAKASSTKIVLSTLVDFEAWVTNSRLAPPADTDMGWSMTENSPVASSEASVRKYALEINATNNSAFDGLSESANAQSSTTDGGADNRWSSSVTTDDQTGGNKLSVGQSLSAFDATRDLLLRYAKSSPVTASGFESQVKAALISAGTKSGADKAAVNKVVLGWFEQLSDPAALAKMTSEDVSKLNNPLIMVSGNGKGFGLQAAVTDGGPWTFRGSDGATIGGICAISEDSGVLPQTWSADEAGEDGNNLLPCNFSIMAMYNYLNTSFGPTSMETFSPEQTMNAYSRTNHASVTAVGAGPAGLLYFFSALSVLGSFVVIGFGYALSMMFSTIKRGFHLMGSVLAASVGLVSGVAKVVVFTAALLLELLGTLFLYKLVQEMILLVPSLLEKPLASRLNTPGGALDSLAEANESTQIGVTTALAGVGAQFSSSKSLGIAALLITLISTIGIVVFTVMAMRMRRGLLDSIDQAVTNVVNKFTETQVGSGMAPSPPGALRQGMSRGASMAASSLMMGGIGGGGDEAAAAGGAGADVGEGGEGAGVEGAAQAGPDGSKVAAPVEGAAGVNGDGSMSVGKDGAMQDAAGNPVMSRSGAPMGLDSFVPIDSSSGHVLDSAGGSPIVGADGSPLAADDVGGFDSEGNMLGTDGSPLTDANGTGLSSAAARQASGSLMGAEALAQRVQANGLSPMATNPLTGTQLTESGREAFSAQQTPPPAPQGPKTLGEVPSSDHVVHGGDGDRSVLKTAAASAAVSTLTSKLGGQRQRKNWLSGQGGGGGQPPKK